MKTSIHKHSPHPVGQCGEKRFKYSDERPFAGWSDEALFQCLRTALSASPINIEIASLVVRELRDLGGDVEKAKEMMETAGTAQIPWLAGVRYRVSRLWEEFSPDNGAGRSNKVYFILLCGEREPRDAVPWGLYIGVTQKKIEERLKIHLDKDHLQRSRIVTRRGWQLLYSLCSIVPTMKRKDACEFEKKVQASLRGEDGDREIRRLPKKRVRGH